MEKDVYAFGHWPSPISAALVAGNALRFGRVQVWTALSIGARAAQRRRAAHRSCAGQQRMA